MNIKKLFIYITIFITSLFSSTVFSADIQVRIDRANIELNQTFTLIFEASDSVDDEPDFSPLKNIFQILNTGTSSNISIINGQYTKKQRWNLVLMPLREGSITIPSISFGKDKSQPYQISVKPVQKSSGKQGEEFISELSISSNKAYPQSQIIVTQRLLSSRNINGYEFSTLKTSGVEISQEALGDIKQYQTKRGETPYLVLEQSYAIYPQSSGTLTLQPSIASARLSLSNRSSYDPFGSNSKTIRRSSDSKTITVSDIPSAFKGRHWLPANEVQLVDELPENENFKVGEPVTRTLSLLVDGQSASQLPEFKLAEITGLKQYPDKPVLNDNKTENGITGIQQIKIALIPTASGKYTLPAISVPWWNLKTNKLEYARLASRTFSVGKTVPPETASSTTAPAENTSEPATQVPNQLPEPYSDNSQTDTSPSNSNTMWKIISLLLALGWTITVFLLWKKMRRPIKADNKKETSSPSLSQTYKELAKACAEEKPQKCKDALISWGNALFIDQPAYSLGELASRVSPELAELILSLNSHLYKGDDSSWQCNELIKHCEDFAHTVINTRTQQSADDHLEDLYR